ncbi:putative DNA ligase 1 [Rosellinia necatrix]|uniref:DNA ligase n=1 Tax=Rosellinia necatrix TaxID=77044 RepID=A0A1S7UNI0_ROSNE|nr:putative DNA ligase 1 [Rosellinia necatrix]
MASPAKKRKLNSDSKNSLPSRGLEYFFAKQRDQNGTGSAVPKGNGQAQERDAVHPAQDDEMTDEELARKLQAEWDREERMARGATASNTGQPGNSRVPSHNPQPDEGDVGPHAHGIPFEPPKMNIVVASNKGGEKESGKGKGTLSLQSVATSVDTISETIPFDESPLTFDPNEYLPQLQEHWARDNGNASYALLTRCFVLVSGTSSRIKIVDTLVNCLRVLIEGDPESLLPAVWLSTNAISPPYKSLELGLGGSAISKALRQVCGLDNRSLKAIYDRHGDAGDVAFEAKKKQSLTLRAPRPLTIRGVYDSLVRIAAAQGPGSAEAKQRLVDRLLRDARGGEESRYVVRTLCQHLRIGAVKTTLLIALSRAFLLSRRPSPPTSTTTTATTTTSSAGVGDGGGNTDEYPLRSAADLRRLRKEELAEVWGRGEEIVKACFARRPDYDELVPALLDVGVGPALLARCALGPHVPLRPMLGSITRDLAEMLTRLQGGRGFACEFKYDGQRAQVHCDDAGKVSIFSRHLELMTDKYPDLVALVPRIRGEGVGSFIMEGEVVAVDQATGDLKNFQTLTNRARKDVAIGSITIDVCLFAFDLMYLNGQPLLDRPFRERRSLLRSLFTEIPNRFTWVRSLDATPEDSEAVLDFFKQATDHKCEGIMVKILDNLPHPPAPLPSAAAAGDDRGAASQQPGNGTGRAKSGKGKSKASVAAAKDGDGEKQPPPPPPATKPTRRKPLLATYEPDKRLDSWLKVKKDYSASFDTLDLVPVAGWHGQGRKARWWSPILLAVRDEETGSLEAVCKCMSGFTDAFYKANRRFYDDGSGDPDTGASASSVRGVRAGGEHAEDADGEGGDRSDAGNDDDEDGSQGREYKNIRKSKPGFVEYAGHPDVWFEPQEVWEVAFADITLSPTYTAAIGLASQDRGLSLRFPRFLRKREDKGIEEASTNEFLAGLFRKQEAKAPPPTTNGEGDDDDEEEEEEENDA